MKTFEEARAELVKFIPDKTQKGVYTLDRMRKLMDALGNPQNKLKVIHVAGTSGKTSTSYFIASQLKESGFKVGLAVSPHVDEVNERVQINLQPLDEQVFCETLTEFFQEVEKTKIKPTYFELLVALAYWYFAREKVDYAVMEVGLGGLLDGTNIVSRSDKICVIADIGLDHTEVLGTNLADIATQKAGIIGKGNQVFVLNQDAKVLAVVEEIAKREGAKAHIIQPQNGNDLPMFQRRNFALAQAAAGSITSLSEEVIEKAKQTIIPARMEIINRGDKTIILDGAHNAQKLAALTASIKEKFPNQPVACLLSLVTSQDFKARADLKALANLCEHFIVTGFHSSQDFPKVSVAPDELAKHCREVGIKSVETIEQPEVAFEKLLKRPEKILLVTGSFYLMNHIRPVLFNRLPRLDVVQGKSEQQTKPYMKYGEGAVEHLTQQRAKSSGRVGGFADQAGRSGEVIDD